MDSGYFVQCKRSLLCLSDCFLSWLFLFFLNVDIHIDVDVEKQLLVYVSVLYNKLFNTLCFVLVLSFLNVQAETKHQICLR